MKLRYELNNNADKYRANVFESKNGTKIIVEKFDTTIRGDDPAYGNNFERFEFLTIADYENWLNNQDWVIKRKIKKVHDFINVKEA
jgi:hypothetical protein